jgi:hypothetical protein
VGKWPRAFTARRSRALTDSIAFVVTVLISRSKARNGTNSAHAFSHSRMIAGYRFSHFPENSTTGHAYASVTASRTKPCNDGHDSRHNDDSQRSLETAPGPAAGSASRPGPPSLGR